MSASDGGKFRAARPATRLALWAALTIVLQGILWGAGFAAAALDDAIEQGSARAESLRMAEVGDELVRKAVRMQEATRPFWTTLAVLRDFVAEPLAPALRAVSAAAILSGLAALVGRPPRFERAMEENANAQGFWVLGLAIRVALAIALRRGDIDTSLALALPRGTYPAVLGVALRQADAFALIGWAVMARGAWRRGQANLATSVATCSLLWLAESTIRVVATLTIEGGMRLTLIPEGVGR